jgi:hypothetical protein
MKTDEELLLNVINHMNSLAMFAPTNADQYVLTGAQLEKLSKTQIARYEEGVVWILPQLAHQIENASLHGEFEDNAMTATAFFQYIFDRSIEALYYVIKDEDPSNIVFDLNEVGDYYELSIPIDLQMTINNVVPRIIGLASNLYQFMEDEGYMKLPLVKWMYFYMYASSFLAKNFLLEQDL